MRFKAFYTTILATILLSLPICAQAAAPTEILISKAPPAPIYEVDPGERPGYILTPGCWHWNGTQHVWNAGKWIAAREGYVWTPDQWEQHGDKWHFASGHWDADPDYYVDVTDEAERKPSTKTEKTRTYRKRINYSDTRKWPRVIHH